MLIGGFQKSSMIDYPDKIAAVVFTQGCNFRCGYCHNPDLLEKKEGISSNQYIIDFLKTRINKLDAVVISGGEPTLQKKLIPFIKEIKELGFLVKLDTNGTNPELIRELIDEKLIDYIAMDIKAPMDKYESICSVKINQEAIKKSIEILLEKQIPYEFRTTVIKEQLDFSDFNSIGELINGADSYYLQKFVPTTTFDKTLKDKATYSDDDFSIIEKILKPYISRVETR